MADWYALKPDDPLPTVSRYMLVGGDKNKYRSYRMFHELSKVKLAITNTFAWTGDLHSDVRVYEWDGTDWQEIYFLAKGSSKMDHPLWKNGAAPKAPQVITEVDVSQAVASILGTAQSEED